MSNPSPSALIRSARASAYCAVCGDDASPGCRTCGGSGFNPEIDVEVALLLVQLAGALDRGESAESGEASDDDIEEPGFADDDGQPSSWDERRDFAGDDDYSGSFLDD
ncbi:MAG: hypothetical protein EOO70_02670 [Myxococcaceae bacterium]|nr:MAG: hypothetical protein EOO70_02670 [Myxococcaceae bacterium]